MADPTVPPILAEADQANAARAKRQELDQFARRRQFRRGINLPLPEDGLFDQVRRATRDLF